jgi:hypothetical protein
MNMPMTTVAQENSGLTIKECDLDELFERLVNVKLTITQSYTTDRLIIDHLIRQEMENFLERRKLLVDGITHFLYFDKNIRFHDPPIPSGSPNSDARYYIWDNNTGLLLQKIPPYSTTSCNFHRITDESFHNFEGEVYICLPEEEKLLNGSCHVTTNQCHRLYTSSEPAINIILTKPPGLGITDHYHPEKCVKELW